MNRLKANYDVISHVAALLLLLVASMNPTVLTRHQAPTYMVFVDVTQSMNVRDATLFGKPISRLEYTQYLLKKTIKKLPCGTKVGLGIFFKSSVAWLYAPLETCENYNILMDTIDHLEWRMASQGSSNIRQALLTIATSLITSGETGQVVFITDGDEAPPLNIFSKTSLANWQGGSGWLLVGVGGDKPAPIPKFNNKNEVIGYWSTYSIQIQPSSRVNEGPSDSRDESIATEAYEYYLSKLDETYLKELANDIHAKYVRLTSEDALIDAMLNQPSPAAITGYRFPLKHLFAFGALLFMLSVYLPDLYRKIRVSCS